MMSPLPSLNKAYSMLQHDEHQRENSHPSPSFSNDSAAFSASSSGEPQYKRSQTPVYNQRFQFEPKKGHFGHNVPTRSTGNTVISCKYCKKIGYVIEDCYRLHGFPADFKFTKNKKVSTSNSASASLAQIGKCNTETFSTTPPSFTQDQYQHYQHLLSLQSAGPSITDNFVNVVFLVLLQVCFKVL